MSEHSGSVQSLPPGASGLGHAGLVPFVAAVLGIALLTLGLNALG